MNSKERFTDRVDHYVQYRPSYPGAAIDYMYDAAGLGSNSIVADIGAGTGIFTKLLLERGSEVIAVEPNEGMRGRRRRSWEATRAFELRQGARKRRDCLMEPLILSSAPNRSTGSIVLPRKPSSAGF
nr:methyltransferase domain-containing protein [Cohnella faecalis]